MGNHSSERGRARARSGSEWVRLNKRALRFAAFSFLLPVPVAMAAPSTTLPTEQLVAMSAVPVTGVGDTVLPRVLPLETTKASEKGAADPAASMTKLAKGKKAAAASPSQVAANGIPQAALVAYRTAEATMGIADPSCRLSWGLLAGIGRVESDHGRYAGAVLGQDGQSTPQIIGLPLNGEGPVAAIADTDNGQLDGDRRWDRAVGPMQFIPSTWSMVGVDGDSDGERNPHDLHDAALAAAAYLCVGDNDLSTTAGMQQAVFSYNHSDEYVALVLGVADAYETGLVDLPALAASQLATGPGVAVGLGEPGRGIALGATDDDSDADRGTKAGKDGKRNQDQPTGEKQSGNTGSDDTGSDDKRSGGTGSDDTSDDKADRDRTDGDKADRDDSDRGSKNRGGKGEDTDDESNSGSDDTKNRDDDNSGPDNGNEPDEEVEETEGPKADEPEETVEPKADEPEQTEEPEVDEPDEEVEETEVKPESIVGTLNCDADVCTVVEENGAVTPLTTERSAVHSSWLGQQVTAVRTDNGDGIFSYAPAEAVTEARPEE